MANDDVTESAAMNENEFRYAGKTYVAVEDDYLESCRKCSFKPESCTSRFGCGTLQTHGEIPHCSALRRNDVRNVHFVEKGESGGASAESTGTQLALQDAEQAEARTREERDKLREEVERLSRANAELAAKNVELLDATEALARTREERVANLRCKVAELNEKIRDLDHDLHRETSRAEALAKKNVDLREEAEWWRREAKKQEGYADALAKKNAWLTAKVAVADWRGGSGGNDAAPL